MVHLVIYAIGARNDVRQVRDRGLLLIDRGCDADWLRDALAGRKNDARIPQKLNTKGYVPHDVIYS